MSTAIEHLKQLAQLRSYGRASPEIWPATEWEKFKRMIEAMHARRT